MSRGLNSSFQLLKVVEAQLRRTTFYYKKQPLQKEDQNNVRDLFLLWFAMWYERLTAFFGKPWLYKRWLNAILVQDLTDTLGSVKLIDELLLQSIDVAYPATYEDFKHLLRENGFSCCLLGEVKGLITDWFDSTDHSTLAILRDLCRYPTQIHLTMECLRTAALEDYLAAETHNAEPIDFTREEENVLAEWFPASLEGYVLQNLTPHHGNGAVAEHEIKTLAQKYYGLRTDGLLRYLQIRTDWRVNELKDDDEIIIPGLAPTGPLERVARVAFVPKSYKSYRTISMEPASLMFWQEGVWESFLTLRRMKWSDIHPWDRCNESSLFGSFSRRYCPESQDHNRELARLGSLDGRYSTIDLHAASDSVRWDLVKTWFRRTCWKTAFYCTRSNRAILPNSETIELKKFAPMGSAVNFLTETAVFAAITESAIREAGGDATRSAYSVYGDDIVVETKYCSQVIQRLEQNGFIVNHEKTFQYGALGYFRESCGGHFFNGYDVTPLQCSKHYEGWTNGISPTVYASLIEQCNQFYRRGYRLARGVLLHQLLALPQHIRPPFGNTEGCILSPTPDNHHLKVEHPSPSKDLRVPWIDEDMVRHGSIQGRQRSERDYSVELVEFLRRAERRAEVQQPLQIDSAERRNGARLVSVRTPAFAFLRDPDSPGLSLPQ